MACADGSASPFLHRWFLKAALPRRKEKRVMRQVSNSAGAGIVAIPGVLTCDCLRKPPTRMAKVPGQLCSLGHLKACLKPAARSLCAQVRRSTRAAVSGRRVFHKGLHALRPWPHEDIP